MAKNFDKFTPGALHVLTLAQEEARALNHNWLGTEHLLLGLTREPAGVAAKVLADADVAAERVRAAVGVIIGPGDRDVVGEIGLTPRAKQVIERAMDEARRFNHDRIGTEHLLLGVAHDGEGIAASVLSSLSVDIETLRGAVLKAMKDAPREPGTD